MATIVDHKPTWRQRIALRLLGPDMERVSLSTVPFDFSSTSLQKILTRFRKQLSNPYGQHPVVYACIKLLADNVGQVPFQILTEVTQSNSRSSPAAREEFLRARLGMDVNSPVYPDMNRADTGFREVEANETPLVPLFTKPNPSMTGSQFWNAVVTYLNASGEVDIVAKERENVTQIPEQLFPMDPKFFTPLPRGVEYPLSPIGWEFRKGSVQRALIPEQLIRPRIFNPKDPLRGQSPLDVSDVTLQGDWSGRLYNVSFFDNDATPGGFIISEKGMGKKQRDEWIDGWNKKHQGALNAFTWALLDGVNKVEPIGFSPKDVQFGELRKISKEELAMIWRIPLVMLSNTENIPNAKDKAERKGFWTDTLIPIIRHLEDIFWAELFRHIEGGKYWGAFDLSRVEALQEDFQAKLDQATTLYNMNVPFDTINARLNMGFEPIVGGDTAIVPVTMVPIEAVTGGATIPQQSDNAQSDIRIIHPKRSGTLGIAVKKQTEEEHARNAASVWASFQKFKKPFEIEYTKKYRRYLFEYRKATLELSESVLRAPADEIAALLQLNQDIWDAKLRKITNSIYDDIVVGAAEHTAAELAAESPFLTATSPQLLEISAARTVKVVNINNTMRNNLKKNIVQGLSEGETVGQLQTRIRQVMNFQDSRALTIARTEMGGAASEARHAEFQGNGIGKTTWQTAGLTAEPKPREAHIHAQGVGPLKIGKVFGRTGCRFPLDPQGPPDQVINCRCVAIPAL